MQPSRAADPLPFRRPVDPLQKRRVEPHVNGRFSAALIFCGITLQTTIITTTVMTTGGGVPIYKLKTFARFARDERINDASLVDAIKRAVDGLVDADLSGGLIKQRVARQGQGRRGGYRVLIAFHSKDFSVFLYGFAKSQRETLNPKELRTVQQLAARWLSASPEEIKRALTENQLVEVRQ